MLGWDVLKQQTGSRIMMQNVPMSNISVFLAENSCKESYSLFKQYISLVRETKRDKTASRVLNFPDKTRSYSHHSHDFHFKRKTVPNVSSST